jgi:hypothetical protein
LLTNVSEEQPLTICLMSDCGCLYWGKQEPEGRDDVQMVEISSDKEVEADSALPSPSKHRPAAEKRKRVTEVQKLKIGGGSQKVPRTEKGTGSVYKRREKGSGDEQEQPAVEKEPSIPQERKTRGKAPKQKKSSNQAVVAKDSKEEKVGAHKDKSSSKVRKAEALPTRFFSKVYA